MIIMKTIIQLTSSLTNFRFRQKQVFSRITSIPTFKGSFIALCAVLLFSQTLFAKTVKPSVAHTVAKHYYQSTPKGVSFSDDLKLSPVYGALEGSLLTRDDLIHVFNINESDGFVLVAGDDSVLPILGYSENGSFDPENLPENFAKWIEGYQKEIRYAIQHKAKASTIVKEQWEKLKTGTLPAIEEEESVFQLMTTRWDQTGSYNDYCPGGSVTGCVATAMAQVLKYWEFPIKGTGFHAYFENDYGILFWNYNTSHYAWWNMPDEVSSSNDDVASLMYQCGVSVNMNYSPSSSGANPGLMKGALIDYFGYDPNMQFLAKNNYSNADWNSLMEAELDAGRPILYGGHSIEGGHRFVCDGYIPFLPDNALFHMNWGWGGSYDGYFLLAELTPDGTGTGGGAPSPNGFNSGQTALIGIQPDPQGPPSLEMLGSPIVNDPDLIYGEDYIVIGSVRNTGVTTFNGKIAPALFNPNDDVMVTVLDSTDVSIVGPGGVGVGDSSGELVVFPGYYYISFVYKAEGSDQWVQVDNTLSPNKTDITIIDTSSGIDMITLQEQPSLSATTFEQNSPFSVHGIFANALAFTGWNGDIAAELYSLDYNYVTTIDIKQNNSIAFLNLDYQLTFNSSGLNVVEGAYRVVFRARSNNGSVWTLPLSPSGIQSNTIINILEPSLPSDLYEDNNTQSSAYSLSPSFSNDQAAISTPGANLHNPTDYDFYKIELPVGYDYEITPRVHDSYNSGNGQTYTNDVRFLYTINDEPFDISWDDVPSPNSFIVQGDNTVHFRVNPYYLGTLGTYLLDIQISRTPSTAVNDVITEEILNVYPNPANSHVFVEIVNLDAEVKRINLYSLTGQVIYSAPFMDGQKNKIPTDNLPDGIYLLNVITEEGISSKKVRIAH